MASNLLKGKQILAVDNEWDVLEIVEEELEEYEVELKTASTHEEAADMMSSLTDDLVILFIMGVRGFELLEQASARKVPVVMLTAHSLTAESLKKSIELGAWAFLPKDQLGRFVPFLEDVLALGYQSAWKSVFRKLGASYGQSFDSEWGRSEKEFWEKFKKDLHVN
jgi:DNA-binding NtrC family response regulator